MEDINISFIDPTKICVENYDVEFDEAKLLLFLLEKKFKYIHFDLNKKCMVPKFDFDGFKAAVDNLFGRRAEWIPYEQSGFDALLVDTADGMLVMGVVRDIGDGNE